MSIQSDSALQIERRTTLSQKGTGCLFSLYTADMHPQILKPTLQN